MGERAVADIPVDDAPVDIPDDESMEMPMMDMGDAPAAGDKYGEKVAAAQADDGRSKAASSVVGLNIFKKKSKSKRKKK